MRWIKKEPEYCSYRVKTRFALLPVTIDKETRWLETVTTQQMYSFDEWFDLSFIDEEEEKREKSE